MLFDWGADRPASDSWRATPRALQADFDDIDAATAPGLQPAAGPIQVVDLFAGCGGLSYGFEAIGRLVADSFRLVGAADIDEPAITTYESNLPVKPLRRDLAEVAMSPRSVERFIEQLRLDQGECCVVIGGPPCQGFSAHRKRHGRHLDDRNSLVVAFAKIALAMEPNIIVMENVPELLSHRHWHLFKAAEKLFADAGYFVRARVVNVAEYGVPQHRFRTVVMASRVGFDMPRPLLAPDAFITVREAIGHLPRVQAGVADPSDPAHVSANHRSSTIDVIRAIPRDGGNRPKGVGPQCLDRVDGFRDVYGRLAWDRPANTITAYARNPASGRYVHPDQDRGLTVREAALLQSFPSWFQFSGSFDAKFSQIGNAVPPRFATALAAHVLRQLRSAEHDGEPADVAGDVASPVRNSFSSGLAALKATAR
jgi:DNA (cytosine-5)-methyltransferase 1